MKNQDFNQKDKLFHFLKRIKGKIKNKTIFKEIIKFLIAFIILLEQTL